jgi:hypothetical protein
MVEDGIHILWLFGLFYDHLVYFVVIWYMYFMAIWYIFSRFGMLYQEKILQPAAQRYCEHVQCICPHAAVSQWMAAHKSDLHLKRPRKNNNRGLRHP